MDYTVYILAEGQSLRMGKDKGLVKINSQEMVLHCIENLRPLKKEIVLVTSNPVYEKFGYRLASDEIKNHGPAQGIITALKDSKTEMNLIMSCDMPLVNDLLIRKFDDLIVDADIVCYTSQYLFPFPGFYSRSILPIWYKEATDGNLKMQSLIKQFNYKTLPIDNPELFLNVNTPEDILLAEQKLK